MVGLLAIDTATLQKSITSPCTQRKLKPTNQLTDSEIAIDYTFRLASPGTTTQLFTSSNTENHGSGKEAHKYNNKSLLK